MAKATIMLCLFSLFLCAAVCSGDWCVARAGVPDEKLQGFIDFVCSQLDCTDIKPGGSCYEPNNVLHHASVCLNLYYRARNICNLEIGGIAITDPSYGTCHYS